MQRCKKCNAEMEDQIVYCRKCGAIQDEISESSADDILQLPRQLQEITNKLIDAYVTTSIKYLHSVSLLEKETARTQEQNEPKDQASDSDKITELLKKEEEYCRKIQILMEENQTLREENAALLRESDSFNENDIVTQKEPYTDPVCDEQNTDSDAAEGSDAEEPQEAHATQEESETTGKTAQETKEENEQAQEERSENDDDMENGVEDLPELDPPEIEDMTAPGISLEPEEDEEEATVGVVLPAHLRNLDGSDGSGLEKPEKTVRPKYCAQCGKPLPEIGLRCTYCGSINELRDDPGKRS